MLELASTLKIDWLIEQGLKSLPTQYRLSGRQFYRSKDPTNSIKVLKEKLASHRPEEAQNPPGTSHRVTSEPLKKKNPITVGRAKRDKTPHSRLACTSPVYIYRTIDCATIDATQHFSKTGLGILYPLCTKPTSMVIWQRCGGKLKWHVVWNTDAYLTCFINCLCSVLRRRRWRKTWFNRWTHQSLRN